MSLYPLLPTLEASLITLKLSRQTPAVGDHAMNTLGLTLSFQEWEYILRVVGETRDHTKGLVGFKLYSKIQNLLPSESPQTLTTVERPFGNTFYVYVEDFI